MNIYLIGILFFIAAFFSVGIFVGRRVKGTNDYYVAGRNASLLLVVGSLIASFLSTGAFLGDTGEVYSGFFMGIVIVGVIQATGYIYGAGFFGRYIRRSEANTIPEYFGCRFQSPGLRKLSALIMIVSVSAYLLSAIQGVATLISSVTSLNYSSSTVIVCVSFAAFTIYSGSPGVLLTDTIMFLIFLAAALIAIPFIVSAAGGWFPGIAALALDQKLPGVISWAGYSGYLYPDGLSNLLWAVTYGVVWALVVSVSPWQTSRYLMARDEHVVMRSSVWSSMGVMAVTISLYFTAAFIRNINPDLAGSSALIWAAMNVLPPIIGIVMLAGISAAGISSASTFLSLIGFSVVNDLLPDNFTDDRHKLRISRLTMLFVSLVIMALAYTNPPQIFVIMYLGGTVIASSWAISAFGSVWSGKLSKTGAFLSMLLGFLGCVGSKIVCSVFSLSPPVYLDSFFIGIVLSIVGALAGSALRPVSREEALCREKLFDAPASALDREKCRGDHRLWLLYLVFGLFVGLFFTLMYALPYLRAMG